MTKGKGEKSVRVIREGEARLGDWCLGKGEGSTGCKTRVAILESKDSALVD